jgi:hypothetical protein
VEDAMANVMATREGVWVLLVERSLGEGGDLTLFWHEGDASRAALEHVTARWPDDTAPIPPNAHVAVEQYNQLPGIGEYVVLATFPIVGHQYFEGDVDARPRCSLCGEPIELAYASDPESWIHAEDANYFGDHSAGSPA